MNALLQAAVPARVPEPSRRDRVLQAADARTKSARSSTCSSMTCNRRLADKQLDVQLTDRGQDVRCGQPVTTPSTARVRSSASCSRRLKPSLPASSSVRTCITAASSPWITTATSSPPPSRRRASDPRINQSLPIGRRIPADGEAFAFHYPFYSLLIARPPATGRIAPVMKSARSLAKNATALAMS